MSNSNFVITNFDDLKYNLYEMLGLTKDASENRIKKTIKKLVLELHPDKNKEGSDEILDHLYKAKDILSNPKSRKNYDDFLEESNKKDSFLDLKSNFTNQKKDIEKFFPLKEEAEKSFINIIEEKNKKHGVSAHSDSGNTMSKYENIKKNRDSHISIPQERISNTKDFNSKFENKKENGVFNEQLIVSNNNSSLGTYQPNDGLATIGDYSNLYAEDSVSTGSYTSLDMAFKMQKINTEYKEKSLEERMKEYKNQTSHFSSRKPDDYSSKNFNEWAPQ